MLYVDIVWSLLWLTEVHRYSCGIRIIVRLRRHEVDGLLRNAGWCLDCCIFSIGFSHTSLILTEGEKQDILQGYIVDWTEYHELSKVKSWTNGHTGQGMAITQPIGDLYDLSSWKGCSSTHHQHQQHDGNYNADDSENRTGRQLDLLFTASQTRNHHGAPPPAVPQLE